MVAFAYPFGAWGGDDRTNDPALAPLLREELARRYVLAFHQDEQETVPLAGPDTSRFGMRRLNVGDWTGLGLLQQIGSATLRTWAAATPSTAAGSPPPVP